MEHNDSDDYDNENVGIYRETPQINMPKPSRNLEPNLWKYGKVEIKSDSIKNLFNEITVETFHPRETPEKAFRNPNRYSQKTMSPECRIIKIAKTQSSETIIATIRVKWDYHKKAKQQNSITICL